VNNNGWVKTGRVSLNITQEEFGKMFGLSARVVSNIELGNRRIKPKDEIEIKKFFENEGLNLDRETSTPRMTIIVSKAFSVLDEDTMNELITKLNEIRSLGGNWSVTYKP